MDAICHIRKESMNHYLFCGVENPILVTNNSAWVPHPFVALSETRRFTILAESDDKYQILELGNALGMMFDFNMENHNHLWILRNFIARTIEKIRSSTYNPKYIMDIFQNDRKNFQSVQDENIKTMYDEYIKRLKEEITKSKDLDAISKIPHELDVFKHSGMACRNQTLLRTVNQNSIKKAEEYLKHDMSGFHDPFLGDTERENRRWNNKQFGHKFARNLLRKHIPGMRNKSTTRAASSSSATSSENARLKLAQTANLEQVDSTTNRPKESRSFSQTQDKAEQQTWGDKDPKPQARRESQRVERSYHLKGEDFINPNKTHSIDEHSDFARLRRFASKQSMDEEDPSLVAAQSEATFSPFGLNKPGRVNGPSTSNSKATMGTKVLYRMRPDELNLVLPKVDTGFSSRSMSRERSHSSKEGTVVNNLMMSKHKSKPLNALIKIIQVADPDDKTIFHLKRRKLRMDTQEEKYARCGVAFKF
jgi:hypothetical protein